MDFRAAIHSAYSQYAILEGRASRCEFWYFALFFFAVSLILYLLSKTGSQIFPFILLIFSLGTLIPGITVTVRRLHDTSRSGWFFLLCLIPFLWFLPLYWLAQEGSAEDNQYGPDPRTFLDE